ncbi:response regulator transcription factor [Thermoleophilia bacterium SCSIO 60948]|nr:response regulator transcription factor [Thermoleophilia bacterium SCSIO 60948]
MTRVLIAEDHAVVRAGLEELFAGAEGIEVVATAADGAAAVDLAAEYAPDVVLMDLQMPRMDGIEATRRITASDPEARIVVLTSFSDQARILEAIDAGAVGYLLKDAEPDELFRGVAAAARGESPLAPKAANAVLRARSAPAGADKLTEREREILKLVASGLQNKQIAMRLGISEKTVKAHLTNVYAAIGVIGRTQATLWAAERGIV